MSFEVFDNVAFYWFLQVMLGIFLIPQTLNSLVGQVRYMRRRVTPAHMRIKRLPEYLPIKKLKEDIRPMWSLRFIFLSILWVIFIMLLIQLPKFHNEKMTDFDPYKILHVEEDAELSTIKRAYRKMSLKWHPDKHTDPEAKREAEIMFVLIIKAYQALTDEAMRENYQKYGNPDGWQGISVTIGLPSFLTDRYYEAYILTGYLVTLIFLVVLAGTWWSHTSQFHKSGIYQESVMLYFRCIKKKDSGRHLINVLAASSEYQDVELMIKPDPRKTEQAEELYNEVFSRTGITPLPEEWYECDYVRWTAAILHSFLNGNPPQILHDELEFILEEAPRLLDVMIDLICTRSDYMNTGVALVELKQRLVQRLKFGETDLRQLPIPWTPEKEKIFKENKISKLIDLVQQTPENVEEIMKKVLTEDEYKRLISDVKKMLIMCPDIDVKYCYRTIDELKVFTHDMITITLKLTRLEKPWEHPMDKRDAKMKAPEVERKEKGLTTDDEMENLEFDKEGRFKLTNFDSAIVHSANFPFQIREKWMVMLYEKVPGGQIFLMQAKALPALNDVEQMDFRFQAGPRKNKKNLAIRVMCDSYVGLDKMLEFPVTIHERPDDVSEELKATQEYHIPDTPSLLEAEGKWYYLYCESFLEMVATLILLFLMWVGLLQSRIGKKYVQPWLDWAWGKASPTYENWVAPHLHTFEGFMQNMGVDNSWLYDEELAQEQRELIEKEEAQRKKAEEYQEELRQKREKERERKEKNRLN